MCGENCLFVFYVFVIVAFEGVFFAGGPSGHEYEEFQHGLRVHWLGVSSAFLNGDYVNSHRVEYALCPIALPSHNKILFVTIRNWPLPRWYCNNGWKANAYKSLRDECVYGHLRFGVRLRNVVFN